MATMINGVYIDENGFEIPPHLMSDYDYPFMDENYDPNKRYPALNEWDEDVCCED